MIHRVLTGVYSGKITAILLNDPGGQLNLFWLQDAERSGPRNNTLNEYVSSEPVVPARPVHG
jgi:hypothetical protein